MSHDKAFFCCRFLKRAAAGRHCDTGLPAGARPSVGDGVSSDSPDSEVTDSLRLRDSNSEERKDIVTVSESFRVSESVAHHGRHLGGAVPPSCSSCSTKSRQARPVIINSVRQWEHLGTLRGLSCLCKDLVTLQVMSCSDFHQVATTTPDIHYLMRAAKLRAQERPSEAGEGH